MTGQINKAWPDFLAVRKKLLGNKDYAAASCLEASYKGPIADKAAFHRMQAWTFAALSDFEASIMAMQDAIKFNPKSIEYRAVIANYYDRAGHAEAAASSRRVEVDLKQARDTDYRRAQMAAKSDVRLMLHDVLSTVLPLWQSAENRESDLMFESILNDYDLDNIKDWILHQAPPHSLGTKVDLGEIGLFIAGPHTQVLHKRLARNLPWELPIAILLMELAVRCKVDTVITDIGANIGTMTVPLGLHFKGEIIAFEPLARNYKDLLKHIQLNNLNNVTALNKACSRHEGQGRMMRILDDNPGMAQLDHSKGGETEIVTLDSVIGERRLGLIKIDVEGHEIAALDGGRNIILRDKPLIIIEILDGAKDPLHQYFSDLGYKGMKVYRSDWIFYPIVS